MLAIDDPAYAFDLDLAIAMVSRAEEDVALDERLNDHENGFYAAVLQLLNRLS